MTYLSEVLADNPTHFWRCADGPSAMMFDLGSAPFHLTQNVPQNGGYSGIDALSGSLFSNVVNGVGFNSDTVLITTPISFEAWFWQVRRGAAEALVFLMADAVNRYFLSVEGNGVPACRVDNTVVAPAAPVLSTQHWHQLAATYDEATIRLYADGVQIGTTAHAVHQSAQEAVFIGESAGATSLAIGFIAEVSVYATALSASRILAHFNAATTRGSVPTGGLAGGPFNTSTGVAAPLPQNLQDVLNAVQHTFPAT